MHDSVDFDVAGDRVMRSVRSQMFVRDMDLLWTRPGSSAGIFVGNRNAAQNLHVLHPSIPCRLFE